MGVEGCRRAEGYLLTMRLVCRKIRKQSLFHSLDIIHLLVLYRFSIIIECWGRKIESYRFHECVGRTAASLPGTILMSKHKQKTTFLVRNLHFSFSDVERRQSCEDFTILAPLMEFYSLQMLVSEAFNVINVSKERNMLSIFFSCMNNKETG